MSAFAVSARRRGLTLALPSPPAGLALGAATAGAVAALAFLAKGGTSLGPVTTTEMAVCLVGGGLCATAILAAPGQPVWGGWALGTMAVLAALTAVSVTWSIAPGDSWTQAGRMVSYLAAFAGAVALARLLPGHWAALIGGLLAAAVVICGYALATKVFPASLNPDETVARLREPFGYWNATGLMGALGVPACLWLGARRGGRPLVAALGPTALCPLLLCVLLAYSRGALLALAAGLICWFVLVPLRLRGLMVLGLGILGTAPVAAWAFSQHALAADRAALADRVRAGHQLGLWVLAACAVVLAASLALGFLRAAHPQAPSARRRAGMVALVALAASPILGLGAMAASHRGIGGTIAHTWHQLIDDRVTGVSNGPNRLTAAASVRSRYWREAANVFGNEVWLGAGANSFGTARLRYRRSPISVQHAHGYLMQTLSDLGLVGLAVNLGLLAAWIAAATRTLGRRRRVLAGPPRADGAPRDPPWRTGVPAPALSADLERNGLATLLALVVCFGVHSTIDWTWDVPATALLALLAAGWVAGRGPIAAVRAQAPSWFNASAPRIAAATAVLVGALGAIWATWQPLRSQSTGNGALAALEKGHVTAARNLAMEAANQDPVATGPLYALSTVELASGQPRAATAALVSAIHLQPANSDTWSHLAQYELDTGGDTPTALAAARAAVYLDPQSPDTEGLFLGALRRSQATVSTLPAGTAPVGPLGAPTSRGGVAVAPTPTAAPGPPRQAPEPGLGR